MNECDTIHDKYGKCHEECSEYNKEYSCVKRQQQRATRIRTEEALDFFKSRGVEVGWYGYGVLNINNVFAFSPKSYKWKRIGKNKWYYSRGPKDFYERFYKR